MGLVQHCSRCSCWASIAMICPAVQPSHVMFPHRRFALVDRSASRLFGVVLADAASETMESGVWCGMAAWHA